MAELKAQMIQRNHQAAQKKPEELKKKLDRDVEYGFAAPINKRVVRKIPGLAVHTCNLNPQFTLTETGKRVEKDKLTYDLT